MFKIAQTPSYTVPVEFALPGTPIKQTFDIEFKRLDKEGILDLYTRVRSGKLTDHDVCHEVVVGWAGVLGEEGDLEFSVENLDRVLNIHPVEQTIISAFFASPLRTK